MVIKKWHNKVRLELYVIVLIEIYLILLKVVKAPNFNRIIMIMQENLAFSDLENYSNELVFNYSRY